MTANLPKYFLPSDRPRPNHSRSLARAVLASARNAFAPRSQQKGAHVLAEELYPHDKAAIALTRAASVPSSTGAWGSQLSNTTTADFVSSLVGESAASRLIAAAPRVSLDGVSSVLIPHRAAALPNVDAQWTQELGAWPVRQETFATAQLGPTKKLITSAVITREVAQFSNAEAIIEQLLAEDVSASLDASLFSAAAASGSRPAGLLAGVNGLTATTGGGAGALQGDIGKLAAIASAVGSGNIAFIVSPATAIRLATYRNTVATNFQVWPSIAVADTRIIAIAIPAFVSGFSAVPKISVAAEATLHMDDTTPLAIGTAGSPATVAAPVRSLFQTDSISIRVILDCAFALRASGAVAFIDSVTW